MPIAGPGRDATIRIARKLSKMTLFVPMPLEIKEVHESVTRNVEKLPQARESGAHSYLPPESMSTLYRNH
jgi:hypothetical protein